MCKAVFPSLLLLLLVLMAPLTSIPIVGQPVISTISYIVLENSTYNATYYWSQSAERTGNLGAIAYSWPMNAYLVAWVNITNPTYYEGDLYVYIRNSTGYDQYIVVDSSDSVKGVDTIVAGTESFLIGYTKYGGANNKLDAYSALVRWEGTEYTVSVIPLGTTSYYEEYVSASYLNGRYLAVFYNSSDKSIYGMIIGEDGSTIKLGEIAYTGLPYNSVSFMVVAGYDEWLVFYTDQNGNIHARKVDLDGTVSTVYKISIPGDLNTAHGGVYSYGKYIIPYMDPDDRPSIAIIDGNTYDTETYTLSSSGAFPTVVPGNKYVLVVWKDTSSDSYGNVYGRLVYPLNSSVSGIIDIGRDTGSAKDDHVFATYNYKYDVYVITWRSLREGDPDYRVYATTLSEAKDLGPVSVLDTGLTGSYSPHGVASGRDGKVMVAVKYYPVQDNADAHLIYGDLGTDVDLPGKYPTISYELELYATPDQGEDARNSIIDLITSARINVSLAVCHLGLSNYYGDTYIAQYIVEAMVKASYRLGPDNVFLITDNYYSDHYDVEYLGKYINVYTDDSGYYMHHKSLIIDNEYVVLSTANYGRYEFLSDKNIILILHNADIAKRFTAEHKEMINGVFQGGSPTVEPVFETLINGTQSKVWVFFSPDDYPASSNTILELIQNATRSIYLMMFHFTNDSIAQALVTARNNGIDVKAIFEAGNYWADTSIHDYDRLVDSGVLATLDKDNTDPANDKWYPLYHLKAMVVDSQIVYIGSAQFTSNGFKQNDEYLLIINNTGLAKKFVEIFHRHWSMYTSRIDGVAKFTNGTPAEGVELEVDEVHDTTTYQRINTTGADGKATVYLVYPYENQSVTRTYTVKATYKGITATESVSITTGSAVVVDFYITETSVAVTGPSTVNVGAQATYTITLINKSEGQPLDIDTSVKVYIDGSFHGTLTLTSGTGSFTISFNTPGAHLIEVCYDGEAIGDEIVLSSSGSYSVDVVKNATSLKIYLPDTIDENQSFTVTVKLLDGNSKAISGETIDLYVKQGASTLYHFQATTNTSGMADIEVPGLLGGSYVIEAVYNGSTVYEASSNSTTAVVRYGTKIIIENVVVDGATVRVTAKLITTVTSTPLGGETLVLSVPSESILVSNTTNSTGEAVFKFTVAASGKYTVIVGYSGSANYMPSSTSTTIEVVVPITIGTILEVIGPSSGKVYDEMTYTIRLLDNTSLDVIRINTTVMVYINGTYAGTVNLVEGVGTYVFKPSVAGEATILVEYAGETIGAVTYTASRHNLTVDITVRTAVLEVDIPETIHVWDNVVLTARLLDENTTPIPGEVIVLDINGSVVTLTTNSTGYVTFIFKPEKMGPLSITITYPGRSGVYAPSTYSLGTSIQKRPAPILSVDIKYKEINETHVILNITGTVKDSLNGTGLDGYVKIYVDKGSGWIYVGSATLVNGVFKFDAVVDPVRVKIEYVPTMSTYYESVPTKVSVLPVFMPAPEPAYLAIVLLASVILVLAIIMGRKR